MAYLKKTVFVSTASAFFVLLSFAGSAAQERDRVVRPTLSQPVNQPTAPPDKTASTVSSRPTNMPPARPPLTNEIVVREEYRQPLIKRTGESSPLNAAASAVSRASRYNSKMTSAMLRSIHSKLGIPYLYGSTGPNRYDCSGFVWSVFNDAGIDFTRQSARSLWSMSVPVEGEDRFKFGTLVFMNKLGHMGIVADENGFYHASSSKGITYSPFKGYWEKRIVGFRRLVQSDQLTEVGEMSVK